MPRSAVRALLWSCGLVALAILATHLPCAALTGTPRVEYRADQVLESEDGTMTQKVYSAPGKQRMEMGETTIVLRLDKGVQWILMPEERMYLEQPIDPAAAGSEGWEQETTVVGPDTVNGMETTKHKTIAKRTGSEDKFGGFSWQTADGIVVKMDLISVEQGKKERFKLELTNLAVGAQDPQLFEVPAGYQKTSMAGFGLGAMGGAMGGDKEAQVPEPPAAPAKDAPPKEGGMGETLKGVGKGLKGLLKW